MTCVSCVGQQHVTKQSAVSAVTHAVYTVQLLRRAALYQAGASMIVSPYLIVGVML